LGQQAYIKTKIEMNNRVEINHRTWQGKSAEHLGYQGQAVHVERYVVPRKALRGSREFNVLFADGRKSDSDPTIILTSSYDQRAGLDGLLARQIGVMAAQRHARVGLSEQPDITVDPINPRQTKGDRRPLAELVQSFHGNYDTLARIQLGAIDSVLNLEDGSKIEIQGPSQSAANAVSMAGVILRGEYSKSFDIPYMDLIDPVNARGGNLAHKLKLLSNLVTIEASLLRQYIAENTFIGHGDVVPYEDESAENAEILRHLRHRQALATLLGGAGLRKGLDKPILKLLTHPTTREAARAMQINFFYGADSTVSLESDIFPTVDAINATGGNAQAVALFDPEGHKLSHHFQRSLARQAELSIAIREDRADEYGMDRMAA
jgi:hypothetical protein